MLNLVWKSEQDGLAYATRDSLHQTCSCDWKYSGVTQGADQLQRAGCRTRDDHLLAVSSPDSYLRSSHYSITQTFYEWAGWLKNAESVCIRSHALLLVNVLKTVLSFSLQLIRWTRLTDIFCFSLGIERITCAKKMATLIGKKTLK